MAKQCTTQCTLFGASHNVKRTDYIVSMSELWMCPRHQRLVNQQHLQSHRIHHHQCHLTKPPTVASIPTQGRDKYTSIQPVTLSVSTSPNGKENSTCRNCQSKERYENFLRKVKSLQGEWHNYVTRIRFQHHQCVSNTYSASSLTLLQGYLILWQKIIIALKGEERGYETLYNSPDFNKRKLECQQRIQRLTEKCRAEIWRHNKRIRYHCWHVNLI